MIAGIMFVVGASIGIWQHYNQNIKNAEPVRVYKDTPIEPNTSPKNKTTKQQIADKSTPSQQETIPLDTSDKSDKTDVENEPRVKTQPNDNIITPIETDETDNMTVHHIFSDIIVEKLPTKAAAALIEYEEIELELKEIHEELIVHLSARPIESDAISKLTNKANTLREQRKDVLEILSKHSNEASEELQATIKKERAAERVVEEFDEDPDMDVNDIKQRMEELTE